MFPCPFILPAAFLLDILAGEPPNRFHPVCLIGRCALRMETLARQRWGGTFHAGMAAALATCIAAWFGCAALFLPFSLLPFLWAPWIPSVLVIYICMAPRSLAEHARKVENALRSGNAGEARHSVSMIVGRDTERMDVYGIARAAIESVAENLTDGVFSTLFWASAGCLAGGASGAASAALAHRVFNILDAMWGKKNERYRHFGTFAARMDDALNFIPARLILPCISFSALMVKGTSARRALTTGWAFRNAHASPNSAWSEAAFAGALGLRLGGPVSYKGIPANYPWIGTGRTKASASDLALAIRLMWTTAATGTLAFTLLLLFTPASEHHEQTAYPPVGRTGRKSGPGTSENSGQASPCPGKTGTRGHPYCRHDRQSRAAPEGQSHSPVRRGPPHCRPRPQPDIHGRHLHPDPQLPSGRGTINAFTRNAGARLSEWT